jgi:hypothetical protein
LLVPPLARGASAQAEAWLDLAKPTRSQSGHRIRKIGEHPLVKTTVARRDQRQLDLRRLFLAAEISFGSPVRPHSGISCCAREHHLSAGNIPSGAFLLLAGPLDCNDLLPFHLFTSDLQCCAGNLRVEGGSVVMAPTVQFDLFVGTLAVIALTAN